MTKKIYTLEEISEKVTAIARDFGVEKVYLVHMPEEMQMQPLIWIFV